MRYLRFLRLWKPRDRANLKVSFVYKMGQK